MEGFSSNRTDGRKEKTFSWFSSQLKEGVESCLEPSYACHPVAGALRSQEGLRVKMPNGRRTGRVRFLQFQIKGV
jgi:hypothetical protein